MRTLWLWLAACASSPPPAKCPEPPPPAPVVQPTPVAQPDVAERTQRACEIVALIFDDTIRGHQLLGHDILRDTSLTGIIDDPRATKPDDPRVAKRVREAMDQTMSKIVGMRSLVWLVVTTANVALASSQPIATELLADPMILNGFIEHKHGVWMIDGTPHLVVTIPIPRERRGTLVLGRPIDSRMVTQLAQSARATVRVLGDGWTVSSSPRTSIDLPRTKILAANRCQPSGTQSAFTLGNAFVVVEDAL